MFFPSLCLRKCYRSLFRMAGVGGHFWQSSSSTPLLQQGQLEWVTQAHIQVNFQYFHRKRLHNLSGKLVPVLCSHKDFFSHIEMKVLLFYFVHTAPCLLLLTAGESLAPSPLTCALMMSVFSSGFLWKYMIPKPLSRIFLSYIHLTSKVDLFLN